MVAGFQRDRAGQPGQRIGVAVDRVVAADILRREHEPVDRHETDRIRAGQQVVEEVEAVTVGHGCRQHARAVGVHQLHRDRRQAWIGARRRLQAIAVEVEPHIVADRAELVDVGCPEALPDHAQVDRGVGRVSDVDERGDRQRDMHRGLRLHEGHGRGGGPAMRVDLGADQVAVEVIDVRRRDQVRAFAQQQVDDVERIDRRNEISAGRTRDIVVERQGL